ncbi:phage antirepressor KilAC domain-containing protein [Sphingobacterium lactis]|uniref:phage antirepressor KilAC domain-containing protein n=1 Tax=Sphingobacterium lactis TaxID=797291 RepID=UPI003EC61CF6
MDQLTKLFSYNGNEVTFRNEQGVAYVNANNMAKPFKGKEPKHWFENKETHDFIHALAKSRGIEPKCQIPTSLNTNELAKTYPSLLIVVKGGQQQQGTWMHEDIALEYAQWLSVDFKLWCNDRIKELLSVGITATPQTIEDMLSNPDMIIQMATQLKDLRAKTMRQEAQLQTAQQYFQIVKPKAEYYDDVLTSNSQITTNSIAMELGVSAIRLNQMLSGRKIIYKQGGKWLLGSSYRGKGYDDTYTYKYFNSKGEQMTKTEMRWTEKGREFIHSLFKN